MRKQLADTRSRASVYVYASVTSAPLRSRLCSCAVPLKARSPLEFRISATRPYAGSRRLGIGVPSASNEPYSSRPSSPAEVVLGGRRFTSVMSSWSTRAYVQQVHRPDQASRQRDVGSQREAQIPGKAECRVEIVDLEASWAGSTDSWSAAAPGRS